MSKSASFSPKGEAPARAVGEEATLNSSVKVSGRSIPMDMAKELVERRSVESVISSQMPMYGFFIFLPIFSIKIISHFLMVVFFG